MGLEGVVFGAPATDGPAEPLNMTLHDGCDDGLWRPCSGSSQRKHDHQCSRWVARMTSLYVVQKRVPAKGSQRHVLPKVSSPKLYDIAKGGCCISTASCVRRVFELTGIEA
jgi:hypothetical protein